MYFDVIFSVLLVVCVSLVVEVFMACKIYQISKAVDFLAIVSERKGGSFSDEGSLEEDESED